MSLLQTRKVRNRHPLQAITIVVFFVIGLVFLYYQQINYFPSFSIWTFASRKSKYNLTSQILVEPPWVKERSWGIFKAAPAEWTAKDMEGSSSDEEVKIAWTYFFNGTSNGLVLELGAMNGLNYSASKVFEDKAQWKSILIEANLALAQEIPKHRPHALSLDFPVCEKESKVHFVNQGTGLAGILEFMTPIYLKIFHSNLLKNDRPQNITDTSLVSTADLLDWGKVKKAKHVVEKSCLPLQALFDYFDIHHVNFMVLDLEGAELSALKSLDYDLIDFDVMCVETNRMKNENDPYIDEVVNFLVSKGYKVFQRTIGRNSWFISPKSKIVDPRLIYLNP